MRLCAFARESYSGLSGLGVRQRFFDFFFIGLAGLFFQKMLPAGVSGREMERGELFYPGHAGNAAGLPGGQMIFFTGNIPVLFKKSGFNKEVVRILGELYDFFHIRSAVSNICDVRYYLPRGNQGNLLGKLTHDKSFLY